MPSQVRVGTCDWERFEDEGTPPWAEIWYTTEAEHPGDDPLTRRLTIAAYTVPRGDQTFMRAFVGTKVRLHVNESQDVIIQFNGRAPVSANLIWASRAAVQPIPG